jgi:type IV pilus assembly protein PilQ
MRDSFYRRRLISAMYPRVLGAVLSLSALTVVSTAQADTPIAVTGVSASVEGESTVIHVATSGAPKFSARSMDGGRRLLVDLPDTESSGAPAALTDRVGLVGGVLTQSTKDANGALTRLVISLTGDASYRIRPTANGLSIVLSKRAAEGESAADAPGSGRSAPRATSTETIGEVRDVRFSHGEKADRIVIDVSGDPTTTQSAVGSRMRLEIRGAKLGRDKERVLDVGAFGGLVRSVSSFSRSDAVVIEVERAGEAEPRVSREGSSIVWTFHRPGSLPSTSTGVSADGGAARRTRTVAREEAFDAPKVEAGYSEEAAKTGEAGAFLGAPLAQTRRFTGARVDIDLKDADIHNVLRILADVGKVNIVTADNVKGEVTLRLRNVPWDQALDVVLQAKALGMVRQGNMVRVALLADLEKEREMAIARRKQDLELAPVETRLIPVSYSQASDLQARAKELLSARGSIAVDERTNMLIARDVSGNLNQIEELVRSLDTQTPQVLVEARIVEATSRYLRDVGIQWGGDTTFSPATGNPTGLAFPASVTAAGGGYDATTPTAGISPFTRTVQNPNFAVNLPAAVGTGQGGALGLTFGSINNAVNLAVRLSAAESSGMLRIVSSPRILTLDNKEARIAQGTLIPFSQLSAQGVQTNFQEAKLQLLVKPHVTADGSVSMHVKINRDEPDFNQTSARGDPTILKREAETDLLIMDGHTAVIGGIFTRNTGRNLDQIPFFGDIPLIGVLFQRRRASDNRGELVIFLTPRIVNRAEALGK